MYTVQIFLSSQITSFRAILRSAAKRPVSFAKGEKTEKKLEYIVLISCSFMESHTMSMSPFHTAPRPICAPKFEARRAKVCNRSRTKSLPNHVFPCSCSISLFYATPQASCPMERCDSRTRMARTFFISWGKLDKMVLYSTLWSLFRS
jgi:hypothetical protein